MQPKEALAAGVPGLQERKGQRALAFTLPKRIPAGQFWLDFMGYQKKWVRPLFFIVK
jgi:hypothetical protein